MRNRYVALLRGINVGLAKRVPMAELRALVEALGCRDVRTLLNSGNVVFTATGTTPARLAEEIHTALVAHCGVAARVTVLDAAALATAVADNPLLDVSDNPSRLLVAVLSEPKDRVRLEPLLQQDWAPEALALGTRVAYLWIPQGVIDSRLAQTVARVLGDSVTSRNWATMTKLQALLQNLPQ